MVTTTDDGFRVEVDGQTAVLDTHTDGHRLVLTHTGVPDELEGQGIGSQLVRAALEHAIANDLTLVPECPFARSWLEKHLDEASDATIEWSDTDTDTDADADPETEGSAP